MGHHWTRKGIVFSFSCAAADDLVMSLSFSCPTMDGWMDGWMKCDGDG